MESRQRSPSYPSTPLGEAIDLIRKFHLVERTNAVERDVAAKAMGYSGLSGRSATILSNLIQFGLLVRTGKNEVRVTQRAVEILYPDSDRSKEVALREAAEEPELFQRIRERFSDGIPSEAALEAYLIRQGFTHTAVPPATRAFRETFLFLENAIGSESYSQHRDQVVESQPIQDVVRNETMAYVQTNPATPAAPALTPAHPQASGGPVIGIAQKRITLGGMVSNQAEADELIALIKALKGMLPEAPPVDSPPNAEEF